ncbi:aminoglycoside phosphotransferase family protein [Pricia sp. S334]|uniref:Aminoglycoside phosphotransferase family protein n=1 Tax=Pricia mediterranea TaxID=3076079 RepID=A0ABU3L7U0_9FLAO|nr:aminoglycoside phosphotransferase family protein [Pricia sp. S334]MDT7829381.1 aminoglycoside phosphotransferase family protein [Pricia sp. S334]
MKHYSDSDLNGILRHFSVAKKAYGFRLLTDGYINDTFLVFEGKTPRYILQRINHNVFRNISGVMNNIKFALKSLDAPDYSKIILVETKSGKEYLELKEQSSDYWRMMTYIDESTAHNTTTDPKIAFEAGRIIAKFHLLLENDTIENYVDTIPRFHDLELRKNQFVEALSTTSHEKRQIADSAIGFAQRTLTVLEDINPAEQPIRICHNDTKLNNILFSKTTGKALCLIDLDTLMTGRFLFDFGDAVRTIVNTAPEDEQDHSKITFEKKLFEAFIDGLAVNKSVFSKKEIEIMSWGAVLMPFLHGIRALTDYLNGNIYYKIAYENQNLDRCLSLFDFTGKALARTEYMREVVQEKLG